MGALYGFPIMSKVLDTISDNAGLTPTQVVMPAGAPHAKGGLFANTDSVETIYVGGAGQSAVSASNGFPVGPGKAIPIEGEINQTTGFYIIGSAASVPYVFLPSRVD